MLGAPRGCADFGDPTEVSRIIAVIAAAFIFIVVWLWKKNIYWKFAIVLSVLFLSVNEYLAVYPLDSIYEREFTRISSMDYPKSGRINPKFASYPDIHGDYSSFAVFEVSAEDYAGLKQAIQSNPSLTKSADAPGCSENEMWSSALLIGAISIQVIEEGGFESEWGVLAKGNLVYFSFNSW